MIQDSWVWVAWVSRAIDGIATLSEAIAETTVASASMITGSVARGASRRSSAWVTVDMATSGSKFIDVELKVRSRAR